MEKPGCIMKKQLEYGSIILRPLEPADIDLLYQWENDTTLWEFSHSQTPFSKHILAKYINESHNDIYASRQLRLMIDNVENETVGAIDLFDFEPFHQRAGIGILIHKSQHRQLGYASDALLAMDEYAHETLGLKQLYANIAADNLASLKLFAKAGYIKTGEKKQWLKSFSGWKDEYLFQKIFS
jgi:diamine N-acetyltransferase